MSTYGIHIKLAFNSFGFKFLARLTLFIYDRRNKVWKSESGVGSNVTSPIVVVRYIKLCPRIKSSCLHFMLPVSESPSRSQPVYLLDLAIRNRGPSGINVQGIETLHGSKHYTVDIPF